MGPGPCRPPRPPPGPFLDSPHLKTLAINNRFLPSIYHSTHSRGILRGNASLKLRYSRTKTGNSHVRSRQSTRVSQDRLAFGG